MIFTTYDRLSLRAGSLEPYFQVKMKDAPYISFGTKRVFVSEQNNMSPRLSFMDAEVKLLSPPEGIRVSVTLTFPNFLLTDTPEQEDDIRAITQAGSYWLVSYGYANGRGVYDDAKCKVKNVRVRLSSAAFTYDNTTRGYEIKLEFVGVMDYLLAKVPILYCAKLRETLQKYESKSSVMSIPKHVANTFISGLGTISPALRSIPVNMVQTNIATEGLTLELLFAALIEDFNIIFQKAEELKSKLRVTEPEDSVNALFVDMLNTTDRSDFLMSTDELDFYCPDTTEYLAEVIVENLFIGNIPNSKFAMCILSLSKDKEGVKELEQMSVLEYLEGVLAENGMALYPQPFRDGFNYSIMIKVDSGSIVGSNNATSTTGRKILGLRKWNQPYNLMARNSEIHSFTIDMTSADSLASISFLDAITNETQSGGSPPLTTGESILLSLYDFWKRRSQVVNITCYSEPHMHIQDIVTIMSKSAIIRGNYIVTEVTHKISPSMDITTDFKATKLLEVETPYVPYPSMTDDTVDDSRIGIYPLFGESPDNGVTFPSDSRSDGL